MIFIWFQTKNLANVFLGAGTQMKMICVKILGLLRGNTIYFKVYTIFKDMYFIKKNVCIPILILLIVAIKMPDKILIWIISYWSACWSKPYFAVFPKSALRYLIEYVNNGLTLNEYIDGLGQYWSYPIANALELLQSCAKPSIRIGTPAHKNRQ